MVMYRAEKKQRELCKVNQIIKKIADNYSPASSVTDPLARTPESR